MGGIGLFARLVGGDDLGSLSREVILAGARRVWRRYVYLFWFCVPDILVSIWR